MFLFNENKPLGLDQKTYTHPHQNAVPDGLR